MGGPRFARQAVLWQQAVRDSDDDDDAGPAVQARRRDLWLRRLPHAAMLQWLRLPGGRGARWSVVLRQRQCSGTQWCDCLCALECHHTMKASGAMDSPALGAWSASLRIVMCGKVVQLFGLLVSPNVG